MSLDVTRASTTTEASEDAVAGQTSEAGSSGGDASTATEAIEDEEAADDAAAADKEVEDSATEDEAEPASGETDLSDGNKVTPRNPSDEDSGAQTGDSSAEPDAADAADDTGTASTGSSGDSGDSGSDSGAAPTATNRHGPISLLPRSGRGPIWCRMSGYDTVRRDSTHSAVTRATAVS